MGVDVRKINDTPKGEPGDNKGIRFNGLGADPFSGVDKLINDLTEASKPPVEVQNEALRKEMRSRRDFSNDSLEGLVRNEEMPEEVRNAAHSELERRSQ